MLKLRCVAQNYDWGVKGSSSSVGRLYALGSGDAADPDRPYAELWMGTHPSGPSSVLLPGSTGEGSSAASAQLLQEYISSNPSVLGEKVKEKWNGHLPFLFKVLSVAKALSIQSHPDKKLAEHLHATQPSNYKDDNHKPEMALAVTPFEALCGFVTSEELRDNINSIPELRAVVGEEASEQVLSAKGDSAKEKEALKAAFRSLMTRDGAAVASQLSKLVTRLQESCDRALEDKDRLILRIAEQYPGDVGVFSAYFLNYVTLQPGEAIYLAANEPHAYLSGECIECMAASDNVVRAGLTPKYRDVETLCSMLTYNQGLPEILKGTRVDDFTTLYTPPFDEFEVERTVIPLGQTAKLSALPGPSVLLVFRGYGAVTQSGSQSVVGVSDGNVFFVPSGGPLEVAAVVEAEGPETSRQELEVYRARVNAKVFA